jgi:hypothetical protein
MLVPPIQSGYISMPSSKRSFGTAYRLTLASFLVATSVAVSGQSPAVAGPSLELPVLIVDHQHRPVDDVTLDQLKVKTGNGQPFAPLAMRMENEDPVSLAILIDASRDSFHDLGKLGDEFAALVGSELLPNDRITLYAADCAMTRSMLNAPPDADSLRKGVADALGAATLHNGKAHSACGKTVTLWDDVAVAVAALSHAPGRRVLLLISSGSDGASKYDWLTVQQYAFDQGVAIFAMRDERQANADDFERNPLTTTSGGPGGSSRSMRPQPTPRNANNLELLCVNTGGLPLTAAPEFRKDGLADVLFLVRKRFILTIPKDAYQPGPTHSAKITRSILTPYFITAAGATLPLAAK